MSVSLSRLLDLPCLKDARVVAGKQALQRPVTSVSVLEYAEPSALLDEFFEKNQFIGSELALTCWYNIRSDIDAQCNILRYLARYGEVGVVLYYLGIVVPHLDRRVLEVADECGIALIVMPEGAISYRYSEVITSVMETIFKDRTEQTQFSGDLLNQVTRLPEHLRTMDTLLAMMRDRLHVSFMLVDQNNKLLNAVAYPLAAQKSLVSTLESKVFPATWWKSQNRITAGQGPAMFLHVIDTEGNPLSAEIQRQIVEVVQLFVNIWNPQHNQFVTAEMVRTILRDEPIKMRRLGELFHIDVAALQEMWVLVPDKEHGADTKAKEMLSSVLRANYSICVCDIYEKQVVAFTDGICFGEREAIARELAPLHGRLFSIQHTMTTAEVRQAYMAIGEAKDACRLIFPEKPFYSAQDVSFAKRCLQCIEAGQHSIEEQTACLRPIGQEKESLRTLAVFLLDCQCTVSRTAEMLCLHPNTVKYRIQKLDSRFGADVSEFPMSSFLSFALAVHRVLSA
jgi:hypothetical protein